MKNWMKRNGIPGLMVIITVYFLYNDVQLFLANRSHFDMIYRWELSGFPFNIYFLIMGLSYFFEAREKEKVANMLRLFSGIIILMMGLIVMFVFENEFGFIGDGMLLLGIPIIFVVGDLIKLRQMGKK